MKKLILCLLLSASSVSSYSQDTQQYREWFDKGAKAYYEKDYKEGLHCYDQAIKFNKKSEVAYHNRGLCKYYLKDYSGAVKDYTKCIELKSNYAEAYINRGLAKMADDEKAIQEAIKDYAAALSIDPTNYLAYFSRGVGKYKLKKYDEAILDFDNALKYKANYFNALLYKGLAYYEKRDFKQGEKILSDLVAVDPQNKLAYYNRALCYIKLDQKDKGCEDLKKSFDLGYEPAKTHYDGICTKK